MTFNSIEFLIFFPVVVLVYFLIPQKIKWIWLLIASYYFYMSWNPRYAILIIISTLLTWGAGRIMGWLDKKRIRRLYWKKVTLIICLASNLGILMFFKYYNFFANNVNALLGRIGIGYQTPVVDVLLPVGISFYTFQALGYIIDVYRKNIRPEKNLLKYALFVSFFPQLVAGPIERSKNLIRQIHKEHFFDGERVTSGLLMMAWGFFKKLVIADRTAILVSGVYDNYTNYYGLQIVVATMFFALQIYCDFSGYSDIAVGAAQVMGFDLMENFKSPYFAKSVSEFWRRWHISLTTWFRDYLYIPLGGNRRGKWIKFRNILITFGLSGLWHGASWHYVIWGLLNGCYQVMGELTFGIRQKLKKLFRINVSCWSYRVFQGFLTFVLVDFAWLFFRAASLKTAFTMILHSIRNWGMFSMWDTSNVLGIYTFTLDEKEFYILLLALIVLIVADTIKGKVPLRTLLLKQNLVFRYAVYYAILFGLLIFSIYGPEFDASTFIYFQF